MLHVAKKTVRVVCGVILIVIGMIGGLIPIFQGWIFVLAGLALLGIKPHQIKEKWLELKERWSKRRKPAPESD